MAKTKTGKAVSGAAKESAADENVLAAYLKEISKIPLLSREEEACIARAAVAGNKAARDQLVKANLRFVVNVAKKYQGQGIPLPDLISEGNIGLLSAVERYDVDKGYHFISYAVWWIRQSICKAICEKSRMIRLPVNRINELLQIERARKQVQEADCPDAEITEIARFLNMDASHVADMIAISQEMISLDNPVSSDAEASNLGDFIEDEGGQSPVDYAVGSLMSRDIESVLDTLHPKEADIIRYRFGLGDAVPLSLKELGDRFNLTKERIRQIEKKALKRLRHPARLRVLESYVA